MLAEIDASDPRAVTKMARMRGTRLMRKLIFPMTIMRLEVTRGSDILIMWVREAELRPRLALVSREP